MKSEELARRFEEVEYLIRGEYCLMPLRRRSKTVSSKVWTGSVPMTEQGICRHLATGGNLAVMLGPCDLVMEVSPSGRRSFRRLQELCGVNLEMCPCVATPEGGLQYYMTCDEGVRVERSTLSDYPGLEFKGWARPVVAPGSIDRNGEMYQWSLLLPEFPAPFAPDALIEMIQPRHPEFR